MDSGTSTNCQLVPEMVIVSTPTKEEGLLGSVMTPILNTGVYDAEDALAQKLSCRELALMVESNGGSTANS